MKKIIGIILIVFGSLWTLVFLLGFRAGDSYELFASVFLIGIGIVAIIIGMALTNGRKKPDNTIPDIQPKEHHLTLKEIREFTQKKIDNVPVSSERIPKDQLVHILFSLNDIKTPFEFESTQTMTLIW